LARNLIVKSQSLLSRRQHTSCEDHRNQQSRRCDAGIDEDRAGIEGKDTMQGAYPTSRRTERYDTLIASTLLVALIAGWVFNFVSLKQVTIRLDSLVAATTRWA
jgi:hypothetical protein